MLLVYFVLALATAGEKKTHRPANSQPAKTTDHFKLSIYSTHSSMLHLQPFMATDHGHKQKHPWPMFLGNHSFHSWYALSAEEKATGCHDTNIHYPWQSNLDEIHWGGGGMLWHHHARWDFMHTKEQVMWLPQIKTGRTVWSLVLGVNTKVYFINFLVCYNKVCLHNELLCSPLLLCVGPSVKRKETNGHLFSLWYLCVVVRNSNICFIWPFY